MVKLNRSAVAAAIVSGCLGLAANSVGAKESTYSSREAMRSQYLGRSGDDSSLPSGVPGVTEENTSDMTSGEVKRVQQALSTKGYDPGRSDGTMTNDTRVAIREFQKDNGIVMTGSVDSRTAARLGIEFSRSSG
jgi:peptidoglycan hydrolase-like protein with peptidoglycan-binding domain